MMTHAGMDQSCRGCHRARGRKHSQTARNRAVFLVYAGGIGCLLRRSAEDASAPTAATRASSVASRMSEMGRLARPALIRSRTQGGASSGQPPVARRSSRACFGVRTPSNPPPSLWQRPIPSRIAFPSTVVATAALRAMGAAAHQERSSARFLRVRASPSSSSRRAGHVTGGGAAGSFFFLLLWLLSTHAFACLAMVRVSTPMEPQILRASFHLE